MKPQRGREMAKKTADEPKRPRATFYFEGKQYEATGKTQAEAEKKAALKEDKMKRGEIGISGNMTNVVNLRKTNKNRSASLKECNKNLT